ncbi:MAG: hypothetical protein V4501_08225 [Pseudomonadota bacterium]
MNPTYANLNRLIADIASDANVLSFPFFHQNSTHTIRLIVDADMQAWVFASDIIKILDLHNEKMGTFVLPECLGIDEFSHRIFAQSLKAIERPLINESGVIHLCWHYLENMHLPDVCQALRRFFVSTVIPAVRRIACRAACTFPVGTPGSDNGSSLSFSQNS